MKLKKVLLAGLVCLLAAAQLSFCSAAQSTDTLRVGVRDKIPGFGYLNPVSNTYAGFEIDLAKYLAGALGYADVSFVGVTADTREEALRSGAVDCVIATFSITEARKDDFDFTTPYYRDSLRVMIQNSTLFTELKDLKGKRIGVASGTTAALALAQYMAERGILPAFDAAAFSPDTFRGVTFVSYDTYPKLAAALEDGSVDAICADGSLLNGYLTQARSLLKDGFSVQEYGVATAKGSPLSAKLERALSDGLSSGAISEMIDKWELEEE